MSFRRGAPTLLGIPWVNNFKNDIVLTHGLNETNSTMGMEFVGKLYMHKCIESMYTHNICFMTCSSFLTRMFPFLRRFEVMGKVTPCGTT